MAVRIRDNKLFIDFYCYLPDGRRVRCRESTNLKDIKKNRKIAEAKDKAICYELNHNKFDYLHFFPYGSKARLFRPATSNLLFSEWWDQWLSEKSIRVNTEKGWNSSYRAHIGPHFGHYPLIDIDEHEILVFRKSLVEKGLSSSTINAKIMKPLRMALLLAHKRELIDKYPCRDIKNLVEDVPDIDPLSFEELRNLLASIKNKKPEYYDMLLIWSRTGLRPGELYALKWKYVDYFTKKLIIRETRLPSGSEGPVKTPSSNRDIELRPTVIGALKRQESRTGLMDGHVFLTHANKPFSDAFMRKKFRHLMKLAGLKYRPPKQMRHTFATLHIAAGENISWVSKTLGHADVQTTLKKYNRFIPNLTREDGSAFETVMDSKTQYRHNQGTAHAN